MDFNEAIEMVEPVLKGIGSDILRNKYDGMIVKKLTVSNTLDEGRQSTNQTHIAITGSQMDIFPYIHSPGYFNGTYAEKDDSLKKYFIAQIPVYLHRENVSYLDGKANLFSEEEHLVYVSIVRSRRESGGAQIQMSMINSDSPLFVRYRRLMHSGTYMILLKRKEQLVYDLYSVKEIEGNASLQELNGEFYKLSTNTVVEIDKTIAAGDNKNRILLPFSNSKACARQIVDYIFSIDQFACISSLFENNDKNIKINTSEQGGNYLRYMFKKRSSDLFGNASGGKIRVFTDKEYPINIDGTIESCRLSTEWVSSELSDTKRESANFLRALIAVVNAHYSDYLRIYEEDGKWYLEWLVQTFSYAKLPDVFQSCFARRYITSLLAKPFVILTGNSGTGKTRTAKLFAEYLEVCDKEGNKNWALIPVGADWTDNTNVLGFYNPLANEGRGKYEKTEILELIERANANKSIPYFIILDEMNLSHVERYFSDFLSHMETVNTPFVLKGYEGDIKYPSNVFVVGTVNIDETTYMFSPKVLDRANVIEFKPEEDSVLELFLAPGKTDDVEPANNGTAQAFLKLAASVQMDVCNLDNESMLKVQTLFRGIYQIMEKCGYEFAYRTVKEIRQYMAAAYELNEDKSEFDLVRAEDEQLMQKVLPKVHGNRKEIWELLENLEKLCQQNNLALCLDKISRMKVKLSTVQYASFI